MSHLIRWLLLLSCTAIWVHTQQKVDLNDLLYAVFFISRSDSKFMDDLQQLFVTTDGTIDKVAYDKELKRTNPSLHLKMVEFRSNYSEIYSSHPGAARFIQSLYRIAGDVRKHPNDELVKTEAVLANFNGLSKDAQDYLINYYPALHILRTLTSQKPPSGMTTTNPATTATPTPSLKSPTAAAMEQVMNNLEKSVLSITRPFVGAMQTFIKKISKIISKPSPWDPNSFLKIFTLINKAAATLKNCNYCNGTHTPLAGVFEVFLEAAVEADPRNLELEEVRVKFLLAQKSPTYNPLDDVEKMSGEAQNAFV